MFAHILIAKVAVCYPVRCYPMLLLETAMDLDT